MSRAKTGEVLGVKLIKTKAYGKVNLNEVETTKCRLRSGKMMSLLRSTIDYLLPRTFPRDTPVEDWQLDNHTKLNDLRTGRPKHIPWRKVVPNPPTDRLTPYLVTIGMKCSNSGFGREMVVEAAIATGLRAIRRRCDDSCLAMHETLFSWIAESNCMSIEAIRVAHAYTSYVAAGWYYDCAPTHSPAIKDLCMELVGHHKIAFWLTSEDSLRMTKDSVRLLARRVLRYARSPEFRMEEALVPNVLAQKLALCSLLVRADQEVADMARWCSDLKAQINEQAASRGSEWSDSSESDGTEVAMDKARDKRRNERMSELVGSIGDASTTLTELMDQIACENLPMITSCLTSISAARAIPETDVRDKAMKSVIDEYNKKLAAYPSALMEPVRREWMTG